MRGATASAYKPSENGSRKVCTRPPGRVRASRIVTSCPSCDSSYPALSPAMPAPMITILFGAIVAVTIGKRVSAAPATATALCLMNVRRVIDMELELRRLQDSRAYLANANRNAKVPLDLSHQENLSSCS